MLALSFEGHPYNQPAFHIQHGIRLLQTIPAGMHTIITFKVYAFCGLIFIYCIIGKNSLKLNVTISNFFSQEKLRKRIHFHGTDRNSLKKYINAETLPKQYGGELEFPDQPVGEPFVHFLNFFEDDFESEYRSFLLYILLVAKKISKLPNRWQRI